MLEEGKSRNLISVQGLIRLSMVDFFQKNNVRPWMFIRHFRVLSCFHIANNIEVDIEVGIEGHTNNWAQIFSHNELRKENSSMKNYLNPSKLRYILRGCFAMVQLGYSKYLHKYNWETYGFYLIRCLGILTFKYHTK